MPVSSLTVTSGNWAGQQPANINIELIKWLQKANPTPGYIESTYWLETKDAHI